MGRDLDGSPRPRPGGGVLVYSLSVGGVGSKPGGYDVTAKFGQVGSLAPGAAVSVAGVKVGSFRKSDWTPRPIWR
jgi:phospholipid/cholesterol/gamma-HCH transport system substrate-binding protein